jgi:tRNA 2-selenouridine synthase
VPQPTTEQFQNDLFEQISRLDHNKRIWVEDESIAIGKIFLPVDFWTQMNQSPMVRMEVSKKVRIERLVDEYGPADRVEFLQIMTKVSKKLGGQNFLVAKEKLLQNDMHAVIDLLLTYYDKAYLASIDKRKPQLRQTISWDGTDTGGFVRQLISSL